MSVNDVNGKAGRREALGARDSPTGALRTMNENGSILTTDTHVEIAVTPLKLASNAVSDARRIIRKTSTKLKNVCDMSTVLPLTDVVDHTAASSQAASEAGRHQRTVIMS